MEVKFIIGKERADYIVKELGDDRVKLEPYEDDFDFVRLIIPEFTSMDALILFHAGLECGMKNIKLVGQD